VAVERKAKKRLYEKALEGVRCVIHEWDPYSLLAGGAPKDEFDSEISAVVGQLGRIHSAEDACHVISRVFSSSFEPDLFKLEHCRAVGKRLFDVLVEREIIAGK
jgi:hypothetical protein